MLKTLGVATVLVLGLAPEAKAVQSDTAMVTAFLRADLAKFRGGLKKDEFGDSRDGRVAVAKIPGTQLVVAYVMAQEFCGSGGCNLFVFRKSGKTLRNIGSTTIVKLPVTVLSSKSHGEPDLSVYVQGGGIIDGYDAVLPFDGRRYASNPTLPPARPLKGKRGKILIDRSDQGVALYPSH